MRGKHVTQIKQGGGIMPGGDRTGPMGMGKRTRRDAGYCSGESRPGYATSGFGFRCGQGYGRGHGFRGTGPDRGYVAWLNRPWNIGLQGMRYGIDTTSFDRSDPDMEKRLLKRQAEDLQIQLDAIRKRLDEIDAAPSSS